MLVLMKFRRYVLGDNCSKQKSHPRKKQAAPGFDYQNVVEIKVLGMLDKDCRKYSKIANAEKYQGCRELLEKNRLIKLHFFKLVEKMV